MGERARESRPGLLDESKGTEMCTDTEGGTGEMALNLRALQVQRLRFESQYPHGSPPCFFTPILRDLTPSPGLFRHQACKWFTDRHVVKAPRCIKLQTKLSRTSREGAQEAAQVGTLWQSSQAQRKLLRQLRREGCPWKPGTICECRLKTYLIFFTF